MQFRPSGKSIYNSHVRNTQTEKELQMNTITPNEHNFNSQPDGLILKLQSLVTTERKITRQILECINEIEIRKIHLARGYSSMFDFMTKHIGYSAGAAQRRLESARLIRSLPVDLKTNVVVKIEEGKLQLSQLTLVQKMIREKNKDTTRKINSFQKNEILQNIENKTIKETEILLAQKLDLKIPTIDKQQCHKDESISLTMTFSKEEFELLEKIKNIKSNSLERLTIKDTILHLAKIELKKKATQKFSEKCCEYKDPQTNKICQSRVYLSIDHIKPRWAGGTDEKTNLQILCLNHNQYRYLQQSNIQAR